ncbi:hypothetical protein M378DRAFT_596814 [Amanita muscaria Koide BX008]|uniref:Uncharacterized protein n=1 Tax=Amanita muscaria (strain Koide BX008) TaxID=946122 RepID=A0A0C2WH60_AMAMK|nr:hypothetical protein M378DRAFT_596814 [Amanita muscaria Koide BX008]
MRHGNRPSGWANGILECMIGGVISGILDNDFIFPLLEILTATHLRYVKSGNIDEQYESVDGWLQRSSPDFVTRIRVMLEAATIGLWHWRCVDDRVRICGHYEGSSRTTSGSYTGSATEHCPVKCSTDACCCQRIGRRVVVEGLSQLVRSFKVILTTRPYRILIIPCAIRVATNSFTCKISNLRLSTVTSGFTSVTT